MEWNCLFSKVVYAHMYVAVHIYNSAKVETYFYILYTHDFNWWEK